jgi:hypothetical protein
MSTEKGAVEDVARQLQSCQIRPVIAKLACPSSVCDRIQKKSVSRKSKKKNTAEKKITHVRRGFLPENRQAFFF